jgi:hypothetical protein
VLDVFLGALDAHLQLLNGENVNWRLMNMHNKLRTTLLIVFSAYIGFIVAGFSLVGLADDSPMVPLMKTDPLLAAAWTGIHVGAVVALLAIVVGGLPLALAIIRRALATKHPGLGLLLVPVLAFMALLLYVGFVLSVGMGRIQVPGVLSVVQPGTFPTGNRLMLAGLMLVFILGAIASTLAVWKVVSGTEVEQETFRIVGHPLTVKVYRFAFVPAGIATFSMLFMLAATLTWGWLSFSDLPQVFAGNFGPWGMSTQAWFIGIITLMSLCTLAAFFGLMRGRSARRTA